MNLLKKTPPILICAMLVACEQSEVQVEVGSTEVPKEVLVESIPWDIERFGIDSTDGLLPFWTSSTLDGGSHNWIYKIDKQGEREWGLLFLRSSSESESTYEVFLEEYSGLEVTRTPLTRSEVDNKIEVIKDLLDQGGVLDQFQYFYSGGEPEEESSEINDADPFEEAEVDVDSEQVRREIVDAFNQKNLSNLAFVISDYHQSLEKVE